MNLDELEQIAKVAEREPGSHCHYPTPDQEEFIIACEPETILSMIAVIRAADAMRKHFPRGNFDRWQDLSVCEDYDALRAKLEEL